MSENRAITIVIEAQDAGERLDLILSKYLSEISRSQVQKLIGEGKVLRKNRTSCDAVEEKKTKVKEGETYIISLPEEESKELIPEPLREDVKIVFEDEDLIVIDKPRDLVVHPGAGNNEGTLLNGLLSHIGTEFKSVGDPERAGIVHRIDKDTSGLLVVAKSDRAYESLRRQFDDHSVDRTYIGLCYNNIKEDSITIDKNLERDPSNRLKYRVCDQGGRRAITHIAVLQRFGNYTLFEAKLETGRTHQIRVHMASIGHPLVGDTTYGPRKDSLKMGGQILHAKELGFTHPATGERVLFESPIPEYFTKALAKIDVR